MAMLRKRSEHNKDTWVLLIDLVKAFDTVNRDCLIDVLAKLGVPPNLVQIIGVLHEKVMVKFEVGDATKEFPSTVGVKQGDNLAPVLFVMFMQVVIETVKKKWPAGGFLKYKSKQDGVLHGRDYAPKGNDYDFSFSLYADDAASLFDSREAMVEGTETLYQHFVLFGMLMHVGRDGAKSKTEAMFCPADRRDKSAKIAECCRAMSNVSMYSTWKRKISTRALNERPPGHSDDHRPTRSGLAWQNGENAFHLSNSASTHWLSG
ncbi:hypothetical protein ScalyP_jg5732 [Parmales sp. scaly parma]|nr:hypothetical protein ScalyP_jg5732 [Parmales sp. scaly parma]